MSEAAGSKAERWRSGGSTAAAAAQQHGNGAGDVHTQAPRAARLFLTRGSDPYPPLAIAAGLKRMGTHEPPFSFFVLLCTHVR